MSSYVIKCVEIHRYEVKSLLGKSTKIRKSATTSYFTGFDGVGESWSSRLNCALKCSLHEAENILDNLLHSDDILFSIEVNIISEIEELCEL